MASRLREGRFRGLLEIRYPIIQAPMAGGPDSPRLAAAVSEAGGLGSLGGAYSLPDDLRALIRGTRALTKKPFSVNLFLPTPTPHLTSAQIAKASRMLKPFGDRLHIELPAPRAPFQMDFRAQLEVVLEERPRLISFTFGIPDPTVIARCLCSGILTMGTATSVEEGKVLEAAGVDIICAQGAEAGGHRASFLDPGGADPLGLFALVPLLAASVRKPIVATGGIMNGAGIAAALALGADAAQLGTAFLACEESGTSAPYRKALLKKEAVKQTRFTRAFSGRQARGLINEFMRRIDPCDNSILPFPAQNAFTRGLRQASAKAGNAEFLSLWAGQSVALIRPRKARQLLRELVTETRAALRRMEGFPK